MVWVPQGLIRSILHQSRQWSNIRKLDTAKHTPISYPSGLATAFQFHGHPVYHLLASMGWHISLHQMHANLPAIALKKHPCLLHITWNLHPPSVDAPVDNHRRSCSFPFIHPREVFLAWSWVITRSLSSCVVLSHCHSSPGVGLTGAGLVHPSHTWWTPTYKGTPASDTMRRSLLWCRMCECPCWSFTFTRGCLLWSDTLPHEACPPICPWSSSSLERHLPWLGQDCQVSNLWCQFSSHNTTSVSEPLPQTELWLL